MEAAGRSRRELPSRIDRWGAGHSDRERSARGDVDFYHWSSQSFGEFWKDALSVLMARERARIGLAASEGDLSRRIVAYAYDDQEDSAADT